MTAVTTVTGRCQVVLLRREDLSGHEDLLHQLGQDVEEMSQVQVHVFVLLQFGRVQLEMDKAEFGRWCKISAFV